MTLVWIIVKNWEPGGNTKFSFLQNIRRLSVNSKVSGDECDDEYSKQETESDGDVLEARQDEEERFTKEIMANSELRRMLESLTARRSTLEHTLA